MSPTVMDRSAPSIEARRPHTPVTVRDIATAVFFFRRRALLALLIPIVVSLAAAIMSRPVYTADARLLILLGDEYVYRGAGEGAQGFVFDHAQIVHSETEILTSRDLRIATLRAIGVGRVYPGASNSPRGLEAAADHLAKDLTVDNVPQSNVVSLSLRNRDPTVAAQTLNALIRLYMERRRDLFAQTDADGAQNPDGPLRQRLADIETQLSAFATQHGFGDYNQAFQAAQAQKDALQAQLQALDEQLAARIGRGAALQQRRSGEPAELDVSQDIGRSYELDALTQSLAALQTQRRLAETRYVEGSPMVADLDRRIAQLQEQIAKIPGQQVSTVHRALNPLRQQLDTQLADAQADAVGLQRGRAATAAALREASARLQELVALGPRYRELQQQRSVLETAYADLTKRLEAARVSDTFSRSHANVRVLQPAEPPVHGQAGRLLLLVGGLVLGVVNAASVVLLSAALFEGMLTPRDVEQKLGLPVVLTVPERAPRTDPPAGQGLPKPRFLTYEDSELLNRLAQAAGRTRGRVLQLIGGADELGVSSLCVDLALATAGEGARVLLLDLEPKPGRSDTERLEELGATIQELPGGRLGRLGGGERQLDITLPRNSQDLAPGERNWERLLEEARKYYDLVVIDAPPLSRSRLGQLMGPHVDLTLIVVGAEETRAAVALNVVEQLQATGADVLGAILNRRRFYIPVRLYGWL